MILRRAKWRLYDILRTKIIPGRIAEISTDIKSLNDAGVVVLIPSPFSEGVLIPHPFWSLRKNQNDNELYKLNKVITLNTAVVPDV